MGRTKTTSGPPNVHRPQFGVEVDSSNLYPSISEANGTWNRISLFRTTCPETFYASSLMMPASIALPRDKKRKGKKRKNDTTTLHKTKAFPADVVQNMLLWSNAQISRHGNWAWDLEICLSAFLRPFTTSAGCTVERPHRLTRNWRSCLTGEQLRKAIARVRVYAYVYRWRRGNKRWLRTASWNFLATLV